MKSLRETNIGVLQTQGFHFTAQSGPGWIMMARSRGEGEQYITVNDDGALSNTDGNWALAAGYLTHLEDKKVN